MRKSLRSWMIGCAIAFACTAGTILIRHLASDVLDQPVPLYLSLIVAVFAAAALGGMKAGLLATSFCIVLATSVLPNAPETVISTSTTRGRLIVFLMEGLAISGCFEAMHLARNRTQEKAAQLEAEVAERKHMERELVVAARNKNQFLATLAHELRNPLAPVRNCLEIMRQAPDDPARIQAARAMIERQVNQMVRLVEDLLDVSRISRNKIELRLERVALAEIVERAVETCQVQIVAAGHHLSVSLPSEPVYLEADAVRLTQVFSNLLTNAAKYTERGGRIRVTVRHNRNQAEVSVCDNGLGIPREMLDRIFEMFTQVEHGPDRSQGGLGVGLSLVKRLAEMHGGSAEAHSEGRGRGSEFVVRLPLAKDAIPIETSVGQLTSALE